MQQQSASQQPAVAAHHAYVSWHGQLDDDDGTEIWHAGDVFAGQLKNCPTGTANIINRGTKDLYGRYRARGESNCSVHHLYVQFKINYKFSTLLPGRGRLDAQIYVGTTWAVVVGALRTV